MKGLDEILAKKQEYIAAHGGGVPNVMRIGIGVAKDMAESMAGVGYLSNDGTLLNDELSVFYDICLNGGEVLGMRFQVNCACIPDFIEVVWRERPPVSAMRPFADYDDIVRRRKHDEAKVAANPPINTWIPGRCVRCNCDPCECHHSKKAADNPELPLAMESEGVRLGVAIKRIQEFERRIADLELERDHLREQVQDLRNSPARVVDNMLGVVDTLEDVSRLNWLLGRIVDHQGTPAVQVILGMTHDQFVAARQNYNLMFDAIKGIIDEKRKASK